MDSQTTTRAANPRLLNREFVIVSLSTACFFFAMGATNPVLPGFVTDELGGNETMVGAVVGSFAIVALACRPILGRLGDARGARLLVSTGCVAGALGMLILVFVNSPLGALAARIPHGFAQAAVMTGATTLAIDLAPVDRRGEAASFILVSFHLGLATGPLLGEWVRDTWSYDTVWWVLSGVMLLGGGISFALPYRGRSATAEKSKLLHPNGVLPGMVLGLGMMGSISITMFVSLYGKEIGLARVAPVFVLISIVIIVVRVFGRRLPDRLGSVRSTTLSLVIAIAGLILLAAWSNVAGLYIGVIVVSTGAALIMPSLIPVAVHGVEDHRRASALATFTMFVDVAIAITGPLFGLIAGGRTGYRGVFIAGAITAFAALVITRRSLAPRLAAQISALPSTTKDPHELFTGQPN
jgi:MFS family permease